MRTSTRMRMGMTTRDGDDDEDEAQEDNDDDDDPLTAYPTPYILPIIPDLTIPPSRIIDSVLLVAV